MGTRYFLLFGYGTGYHRKTWQLWAPPRKGNALDYQSWEMTDIPNRPPSVFSFFSNCDSGTGRRHMGIFLGGLDLPPFFFSISIRWWQRKYLVQKLSGEMGTAESRGLVDRVSHWNFGSAFLWATSRLFCSVMRRWVPTWRWRVGMGWSSGSAIDLKLGISIFHLRLPL